MSIYATLWALRVPSRGDFHAGCSWFTAAAQGFPDHVGAEGPDVFASFLPPLAESAGGSFRAAIFVPFNAAKGTARSPHEYAAPLLVLSGREYITIPIATLQERLADALRGENPRLLGELPVAEGRVRLTFEDGTDRHVTASG